MGQTRTRRQFLRDAGLLSAASLLAASRPGRAADDRPHLVLFLSDDHGYWDSTAYGATDVRTPNMARLAAAGLTFTQAFVASPACAPSRAALLTGLMPARNGAEANHTYPRPEIPLLPSYLQQLGYEVAAFGKVAHGAHASKCGFDHVSPKYDFDTVAAYVRERKSGKPLCLFVGSRDPHVPWAENESYNPEELVLPPEHVDTPETRQQRANYYTDVTQVDTELGALYDFVQETLPRNTLFLYTSDHGAQWPFGKWNLYEAGIRTPMLAAWPGVLRPGSKTDALVSWVDLLPTLIELAGGTPPADLDGRSFAEVLRGRRQTHRDRIFVTHSGDGRMNVYPLRALRTQRWKYILNLHPEFAHTTHIDQARGKDGLLYWLSWCERAKTDPAAAATVTRYHRRPREELYDLKADPHELHNLADLPEHAQRLAAFRAELQAWMEAQGDQGAVFQEPRLLANPEDWAPAKLDQNPAAAAPSPGEQKLQWRYTTVNPGQGWEQPGFDDGGWKVGPSGFGKVRHPAARVRTPWLSPDLWIRRTFAANELPAGADLLVFHDEDVEIFLNGVLVGRGQGHSPGYVRMPLSPAARQALRPDGNVVAAHCHQTVGGQYLDLHFVSR